MTMFDSETLRKHEHSFTKAFRSSFRSSSIDDDDFLAAVRVNLDRLPDIDRIKAIYFDVRTLLAKTRMYSDLDMSDRSVMYKCVYEALGRVAPFTRDRFLATFKAISGVEWHGFIAEFESECED